jgi:hypothetical protein
VYSLHQVGEDGGEYLREAGQLDGDAEAIARVHVESSQDAYAPVARDWPTLDLPACVARWASSLEGSSLDPRQVDLVATVDDIVVGFIGGGPARRTDFEAEQEVYVIHVLPGH